MRKLRWTGCYWSPLRAWLAWPGRLATFRRPELIPPVADCYIRLLHRPPAARCWNPDAWPRGSDGTASENRMESVWHPPRHSGGWKRAIRPTHPPPWRTDCPRRLASGYCYDWRACWHRPHRYQSAKGVAAAWTMLIRCIPHLSVKKMNENTFRQGQQMEIRRILTFNSCTALIRRPTSSKWTKTLNITQVQLCKVVGRFI